MALGAPAGGRGTETPQRQKAEPGPDLPAVNECGEWDKPRGASLRRGRPADVRPVAVPFGGTVFGYGANGTCFDQAK